MNKEISYIYLDYEYFYKNDIIVVGDNFKAIVLEDPHKKWWKQFFQFITFGLYKAPTEYKLRLIDKL